MLVGLDVGEADQEAGSRAVKAYILTFSNEFGQW
jgi:hypothetical protein